ncbi:MAG TPA: MerR family transcriptional regulator [Pirellulales bacterium]
MRPPWKIAELAEVVSSTLASEVRSEQPSGRVRDVPDLRTIRYYTTLGLLDRPFKMQGRTAYYGWRHVWQLLAIKQLQAGGLSLVDVQEQLAGADDRTLKKLARVSDRLLRTRAAGLSSDEPAPLTAERTTFWADPAAMGANEREEIEGDFARVLPAMHLKLAEGVTLVLEDVAPGALRREQLAAIERAARGLITPLRQLGIIAQPGVAEPDTVRQSPLPDTQGAERSRS